MRFSRALAHVVGMVALAIGALVFGLRPFIAGARSLGASDQVLRAFLVAVIVVGLIVITIQVRRWGVVAEVMRRGTCLARHKRGHLRLVRLYMEGGLLVTALALVPTLLNLLHVPDTVIWPLASAAAGSIFTFVLLIQFRRRRAIEPGRFPLWVVIVYAVSTVAVAGLWFIVAGIPFSSNIGPYAIVLTWALCIFGFIFVRLTWRCSCARWKRTRRD